MIVVYRWCSGIQMVYCDSLNMDDIVMYRLFSAVTVPGGFRVLSSSFYIECVVLYSGCSVI